MKRGRIKIARAKNSGGAAGGGAALEQRAPKGRANQIKFDIFDKRPAGGGGEKTLSGRQKGIPLRRLADRNDKG